MRGLHLCFNLMSFTALSIFSFSDIFSDYRTKGRKNGEKKDASCSFFGILVFIFDGSFFVYVFSWLPFLMCLPLKAAIDVQLNTHTSMICVCMCMNNNEWAVSMKMSSYLWDGCRAKIATQWW